MRIKRFWVSICVLLESFCAHGSSRPLPTIDEAASNYIEVHAEDNHWRLFSITMPPESKLADHQSGARAVIPITDIKIQRLEGSSEPMIVPAYQALWLTNQESKGFKNISNAELQYLVLESKNKSLTLVEPKPTTACDFGKALLSYNKFRICSIEPGKEVEVGVDTEQWLYVPISGSDKELELKFNGSLLPRPEQGIKVLTKGRHKLKHHSESLLLFRFNP